jgi:anti-sigma-K factor RskA
VDIKEYIATGILENYVLGAVSEQERKEVECLSKIYPEIGAELKAVQMSMEAYVQSLAVAPPAALKNKILAKIAETPQEKAEAVVSPGAQETPKTQAPIRPLFPMKIVAAAAAVLLLFVSTLFFMERGKSNALQADLDLLEQTNDSTLTNFEGNVAGLQAQLDQLAERERIITATSTRELLMAGTESQPAAQAKIYWDQNSNELLVYSDGLPTPVDGKQYQLWAIADGVPVDLGMLDKSSAISNPISVKVGGVQAFAITLEKEGGVASPTLEQMYVIVSV